MPTIEEVYCKFGFVSEAAQLLETELATLLLHENAIEKGLMENSNTELVNAIYEKINHQTLGNLIHNSKSKIKSVEELDFILAPALIERNRLAHSFYREHNFRLRSDSEDGRIIMLNDLDRMHSIIFDAYKAVMLISGIDLDSTSIDEHLLMKLLLPSHVKI